MSRRFRNTLFPRTFGFIVIAPVRVSVRLAAGDKMAITGLIGLQLAESNVHGMNGVFARSDDQMSSLLDLESQPISGLLAASVRDP